jgi:uncharacterized protein involved in exopolysaccharide biosynthesis
MSAEPDRTGAPRQQPNVPPLQQVAGRYAADLDPVYPTPAARAIDYLRAGASRWRFVAIATACVLLGAGIYLTTATKRYDATADVVTSRSDLVQTLFPGSTSPSNDPERDVNTNLALISSETIAGRVRRQLRLPTAVPALLDQVTASTKGNSNVISITARDTSPAIAATIANAFAAQYVNYQNETSRAQFSDGARSIQQRLDQMSSAGRASPEGRVLNQRLQQMQVAAGLDTGGVRLLDAAVPAASPASPRTKQILALALVVGLLLGCACALGVASLTDPALRR